MTDDVVLADFPAHRADRSVIDGVALLMLNRPSALNALNSEVMAALVSRLEELDVDPSCRVVVIRGSGERAFAAGADIKEMADATPVSMTVTNNFARWERVQRLRKPLIAAVRGFALGGGCELAMTCDMIVAAEDAQFGQPEIKLGIIPGAGGTQRLTRAIGKARAMELILTGRTFSAREAERWGLVSSVVPNEAVFEEALGLAARIAAMPPLAVMAAKEAVERAEELSLSAGLEFERRQFYLLFASDDQKEGMRAFVEKRPPDFHGR
jgi:enoyl-CoA hydratase